jgi:hypothetical protein
MKTTILLHGFNVRDNGESTVEKLSPFLFSVSKSMVITWKYGWFGLFSVLFKNKKVAKSIRDYQQSCTPDNKLYAAGHSNGCAIIVRAASLGAEFESVLLINPALKSKTKFPQSIKKITVVHTNNDIPTKTASFLDKVPFIQLIIPNAWGAMGNTGYIGDDSRVTNINLTNSLSGHSDIFSDNNMSKFGYELSKELYNVK